jgi:hypothetical protein
VKKSDNTITLIMSIFFFIIFCCWKQISALWGGFCGLLQERGIPPGVALAALIAGIIIIPASLFLRRIKKMILQALPENIEFCDTFPEKYHALDGEALARYTEAFESLGFKIIRDYTTSLEAKAVSQGFGRLFANDDLSCFAEVNQVFPETGAIPPLKSVIISYFHQGWCLSTSDREPDGASYMIRLPRALWSSHPDAPPAQLVSAHLERRKEMLGSLQITLSRNVAMKAYFSEVKKYTLIRREAFKKKSMVLGLYEFLTFKKEDHREWMGDLYGELEKKRASRG